MCVFLFRFCHKFWISERFPRASEQENERESCPQSCCGLVRGETDLQEKHLLRKHFLHNNSKTGVSLLCVWWWHMMQSTQLQQIQSNFRWFFVHHPSFSVSPFLTSLSSSPPPSSSIPSQIPSSIFLACVKLFDKKVFGLNDFIEKEIQYKDCLEKSFVAVIRYYKIHFYSKIIGSLFRTNLRQLVPFCHVVTHSYTYDGLETVVRAGTGGKGILHDTGSRLTAKQKILPRHHASVSYPLPPMIQRKCQCAQKQLQDTKVK